LTVITTIAQRILDENNWVVSDISLTNLEYVIDNAIDYINMEAGTSIADLSGAADSKSLTGTDSEIAVVKLLSVLMVRAYKDRGPQVTTGTMGVQAVISDPQYHLFTKLVTRGINRLSGRSFERT